jgi:hypothetical protein
MELETQAYNPFKDPNYEAAEKYCLSFKGKVDGKMSGIALTLIREYGPRLAETVWRLNIASQLISDGRGGKRRMSGREADMDWDYLLRQTTTTKNGTTHHETTTATRTQHLKPYSTPNRSHPSTTSGSRRWRRGTRRLTIRGSAN